GPPEERGWQVCHAADPTLELCTGGDFGTSLDSAGNTGNYPQVHVAIDWVVACFFERCADVARDGEGSVWWRRAVDFTCTVEPALRRYRCTPRSGENGARAAAAAAWPSTVTLSRETVACEQGVRG